MGEEEPRDRALLERHRPRLRFDPQYDYRVLAADSAVANPPNILRRADREVIAASGELDLATLVAYPGGAEPAPGDHIAMGPDHLGDSRRMEADARTSGRIYGRVVADRGRTWLQYWFWLYYNPKHLLGFGRHEGDWEMVQVGLGPGGEPEVATYAQHDTGEPRRWRRVETVADDPGRPVVYVAPQSHASYFEPGAHPYWPGIDHPYAGGPAADLPLAPFGAWTHWPGRWGNRERRLALGLGSGPRSPGRQGEKWDRPGLWHERMRRRGLARLAGRALEAAGRLTYPLDARIAAAEAGAGEVRVRWRLAGRGPRRGRHLHLTAHERHFVIGSRVLERAPDEGEVAIAVPAGRRPTAVMASAYNLLRQRGEVVAAPLDGE